VSKTIQPIDLSGRTALVTGASRGLGAALSIALATAGAHTILLARTVGGLEEVDDQIHVAAPDAMTTLVPVDLTDTAKLDGLGPSLVQRFPQLDIFIANAAILGGLTPLSHYEAADWRRVFDVNVHANWHLIRSLEPLLQRSPNGQAIFMTADVATTPRPYWGAYAAAKAAMASMAATWQRENAKSNLQIDVIDPGPMATRLRAEAYPGEDRSALPDPSTVAQTILQLISAADRPSRP